MTRTLTNKFLTGKDLERTKAKHLGMLGKRDLYSIGNERYILERCTGKTERYKVHLFYEVHQGKGGRG